MVKLNMTELGQQIFERTYSRRRPGGEMETWEDTIERVVSGNTALAPVPVSEEEKTRLRELMREHKLVPAGRHLYMSGVEGRQYLNNCHVSGWGDALSDHFVFTFLRLMEGGGVGADYSNTHLTGYEVQNIVRVQCVCDREHPDYAQAKTGTRSGGEPILVEDSREGWAEALKTVIDAGEGNIHPLAKVVEDKWARTVYLKFDLSNIRPAGSEIKTFGGTAAGPGPLAKLLDGAAGVLNGMWMATAATGLACMELDHLIAQCVISGNVRRSARMSMMHWGDPEIWGFLKCKKDGQGHWSTNISVIVDEEFWDILKTQPGNPKFETATKVWEMICQGMARNGEPGFWDRDLASKGEQNRLYSVNPCGEVGLEPWEACNIGNVNLAAFVDENGVVDHWGLYEAHRLMTRFLIRATFGDYNDPRQKEVTGRNRRIFVGHLGYAWFTALQGIKYSESWKSEKIYALLGELKTVVRSEASAYAFRLRIPAPIKVTGVAPTGTVSKLSGVTPGIQPVYARWFIQRIRFSNIDPAQARQVEEYQEKGYKTVPDIYAENTTVVEIPMKDPILDRVDKAVVEDASEISIRDALNVQAMYQEWYADNSVSYTVNVPPQDNLAETLEKTLPRYAGTIKGTTVMVDETRKLAPWERVSEDQYTTESWGRVIASGHADPGCANGACPIR